MRVFPRQTTRTRPRSCRSDPKGIGGLCQQPSRRQQQQPVPPAQPMVECQLCRRRLARGAPGFGGCWRWCLPWEHAPGVRRATVHGRTPVAPDYDAAAGRRWSWSWRRVRRRPFGNYGWEWTRGWRVGTIVHGGAVRW